MTVELTDPRAKFTIAAILAMKEVNEENGHPEYGTHVVYSGFNAEFKRRFNEDSKEVTDALASEGVIVMREGRGGPSMWLPSDAPAMKPADKAKAALRKLEID